jgi:hypothetical protein
LRGREGGKKSEEDQMKVVSLRKPIVLALPSFFGEDGKEVCKTVAASVFRGTEERSNRFNGQKMFLFCIHAIQRCVEGQFLFRELDPPVWVEVNPFNIDAIMEEGP